MACRAVLLLLLIGSVSCSAWHASTPVETTAAAPPSAPAPVVRDADGTLPLSPENTRIEFVSHAGRMPRPGSFTKFTGTLHWLGDDFNTAILRLEIDTDSASTNDPGRTVEIKSATFLNTDQFPKATFESTGIEASPIPDTTHLIVGNLTLHGVTKRVAIPVAVHQIGDRLTLTGTTVVRQSDFGMEYGARMTQDAVAINLSVRTP
jgi:polyisoprenoid-binding protein YceI